MRMAKGNIKEYLEWAKRCGVDTREIIRRINEGEDTEDIVEYIYNMMNEKMMEKEFDFEGVWEKTLKGSFTNYVNTTIDSISEPIEEKEEIDRTKHKVEQRIKKTYAIKKETIYINDKKVSRIPETKKGLKSAITYYKNRYKDLDESQVIKLSVYMDELKESSRNLSHEQRNKYLIV